MSIGAELLRFSNREIVLFDQESQRLNILEDNLPFQCSWIVANREKIISRNSHYLRWPNFAARMSKDAAVVTRFNPRWVEEGDDPTDVLDKFESYILDEKFLIVGHNILSFDFPLYQLWRKSCGRKKPNWSFLNRVIDTHLVARGIKEGWKIDRQNLLAWQFKSLNSPRKGIKTSISVLCKEWGIPIDETRTHEAGYDLELNWEIYKKVINMIEI